MITIEEFEDKVNKKSILGSVLGSSLVLGGLIAVGTGIYIVGETKGWWDKFKRK